MLTICENNRQEIENEYLALLLNKNDLFNFTQIKPEYLYFAENKRILKLSKSLSGKYKKYL